MKENKVLPKFGLKTRKASFRRRECTLTVLDWSRKRRLTLYKAKIRQYKADDYEKLCQSGLREEDERECARATGQSAKDALGRSLELSMPDERYAFVGMDEGEDKILALAGLAIDGQNGLAAPWLLACERFDQPKHARGIALGAKRLVDDWLERYGFLTNVFDPEHKKAERFLLWLGFAVDRENPVKGLFGHEFLRFWRSA